MKSIKGTRTEQNLLKAFAGESQARNRYNLFASQAQKEGFNQIAKMFNETAENERIHAKRFFGFLEGGEVEITATYPAGIVKSTYENLLHAAHGENEEYTVLYPEFAAIAKEEGFLEVSAAFTLIAKVEKEHEQRYLALAKNIEENHVFSKDEKQRWKCDKCGYIHESKDAPDTCPACQHPKAYFELDSHNY
jgi:rubrerythrin